MAAACARGTTVIMNAACEPHVQDLCQLLCKMGVGIDGIGSNVLVIEGAERAARLHATGSAPTTSRWPRSSAWPPSPAATW